MKLKKFLRKHWLGMLLFFLVVIIFTGIFSFLKPAIGYECGYWSFFEGTEKKCECLGIKTGGCPSWLMCEGSSYGCIGICRNCICKRFNPETQRREEVSCELLERPS